MRRSMSWVCRLASGAGAFLGLICMQAQALGATVYKCPGPPVLYTDAITPKEAKEKGCTPLEGAPVTVAPPSKARGSEPTAPAASPTGAPRVDPGEQRARDSDRKQILASELKKEEASLAALQAEYNNGEPERLGGEKNYQKYLDRTAELKAAIARKGNDLAALKRELAKLP